MEAVPPIRSIPLTCSGHTRPVVHLEHSVKQPDGSYLLLSSCKDGNPMLRDWLGDWVGTFLGHKGAVWCARLSGDNGAARAVSGSADFSAKVWDTYTGECLQTIGHGHIVRSVAIDRAGASVLTGGHERTLRLFDLAREPRVESAAVFGRGAESHATPIRSVVQSWADERVVATAEDRAVHWWDVRTLARVHSLAVDEPIVSMERSTGAFGEYLALASGRHALFVDLRTHEVVRRHALDVQPSCVSLHPTGARFVAGCVDDEWVRVYDADGTQLDVHKGHHGPVHCVSYTPDGQVAASGSEDGTIRLWQNTPGTKYGLWA